jgi:sulfite reductase alpha subunit-like flavoprotein
LAYFLFYLDVGKINPVEHPLILIVSSTYEDAPPQNALAFSAWLDKLILESSDANYEINPDEEIAGPPRDPPPSPEEYRMSLLRGKSRSVKRVNPFKGVKFAVLGVGNSQWVTYQTAAKRLDEKIEKLGGCRLLKMGEMDVDGKYEEDLLAWKKKWLQSILNEFISFEDTSDSFVFDEIKVRNSVKMSPRSK